MHPERGFLLPDKFIPLFEKNGFITELDFYVWDTVCAVLRRQLDENRKITPISVNVSRTDIYNPNLPNILMGLMEKYTLKPGYLHLEITETAYTENPSQLIKAVQELKDLGFIVEMDDFGSGYSSLNMLSQMPLDILKLDMKFIQNETQKTGSKNILGFVISLAKWLDLSVVAEGVETKEQLDTLRNMDCTYVQGYYYAKPMPLEAFEKKLLESAVKDMDPDTTIPSVAENKIAVKKNKPGRTMVVVDDVELNRAILSEIFSDAYTIVEAENGKVAYDYVVQNYQKIDVILLDLVMPVMDGFQLLGKLKSNDRFKHIPVVVTSQTGENSEVRALSMGASDFIGKPYNAEVALHRVNNVLAESRLKSMEREKELSMEIEEMRYKAEHDSLTGLYNRTALETYVNTCFTDNKKSSGSFIMIDIDNFKTINDVFGHDKGDEVLIDIAKILRRYFRKTDIVTRLGGDEFAAFIPSLPSVGALEKKINLLCKKLQLQYGGIEITATAGASVSPQQGTDYQTLYKNADTALLAAKRLGKNQYKIFDEEIEMPSPVLTRNLDWLLDETSDAIMVCDTENYDILYLNHVACEMCGKSRKEMGGKKCYEFLWGNTEPCSHCVPLDRMEKTYCEHEVLDAVKGKHYIIKGKLTEWGGKTARIQFIQDNTGKAMAAKQLADVSADRKRLLDLMPGGIFRYKAKEDDTFDFVSENMLKMLGYSSEEFRKKFHNRFSNMVWHEDRARILKEIDDQIAVRDSDECDYRIEKGDGSLCWVHDIGRLVKDTTGQAWFYVAIMDITREHRITEKLEEERKKLEIALSHSKLQYWEHDLRTDVAVNGVKGADLGFAEVTPNYSRFLIESGIVPADYIELYKAKQQLLYGGAKSVEYEIPLHLPNGGQSWWHICCTNLFDASGKPIKTIGTAENIDRLKEYEHSISKNKTNLGGQHEEQKSHAHCR